jgi:hypothetical protein
MQYSGGLTTGHEGLNFFEHRGFRHEWESRGSMSIDSLLGAFLGNEVVEGVGFSIGNITGTFSATETIRGDQSGATAVVLISSGGPSAIFPVGSHWQNFQPGETVRGLTSGATGTYNGSVATATVWNFFPVGGTGGKTLVYRSRAGAFVTNQTVRGQTSFARARFLSLFEPAASSQAQSWQTLIFGMHRGPVSQPVPAEVPGPVVVIVPGREAPALGALSLLPIAPSFIVGERLVAERTELVGIRGDTTTWPKFSKPRSEGRWVWSGIKTADRDTLLAFFAGLGKAVFRWTPPHGVETAYAKISPIECRSLGLVHELSADVVELQWIG